MEPKSYKGIINHYKKKPEEIRECYKYLPKLATDYPFDVALSYSFARLETVQHIIIRSGIVKLYRCDIKLTDTAVRNWHITRPEFLKKIKNIFGKDLPTGIGSKIIAAEDIRDNIMHGKSVSESNKRNAIADLLDYSQELGDWIKSIAGFNPFGKLTGFKGNARPLNASTTRWILRGIGFDV